jgi:hypothetical protein
MGYSNNFILNNRAGISVSGISRLCVSINSSALKLKKSLDDIYDLIDDSSSYFSGDTRNDFVKKFNDVIIKRTMIKNNILSYVDDYNSVASKFKTMDSSITFNEIKIENGGKK